MVNMACHFYQDVFRLGQQGVGSAWGQLGFKDVIRCKPVLVVPLADHIHDAEGPGLMGFRKLEPQLPVNQVQPLASGSYR